MTRPSGHQSAAEPYAVSVVVPAYNAGGYLAEQLHALTAQCLPVRWEVVIADNGTTDGSLQVVAEFADRVDVRVVDAAQVRGPSHARNAGVRAARGEWVAFCDADDRVTPTWLSHLYEARQDADVLAGGLVVDTINPPEVASSRGSAEYWTSLLPGPCQFLAFAPTSNMLVRRDVFLDLGGFDEHLPYCEDVDFSWKAQLQGHTLALAPDALVEYRFRTSIRETYDQTMRYKAAEPQLYLRYRSAGARRQTVPAAFGRLWWLASRSPYAVLDTRRRFLWWSILGTVVGRLRGSLRYRVLYP